MPAGVYRLFGYRVVKGKWMISTTAGRQELKIEAGRNAAIDPSSTIHLNLRARRQRGQVRVNLGITNGQHMGLSLYKDGARIPLTYSLLDAKGKELTSGPLNYG